MAGRPNRRFELVWPFASLAVALACGGEPAPAPPDLLLITVDTLRADRLGCYGGESDVGRAICRLGEEGTRYVWAVSPAPSTAPAIASILTSRYPSSHGVSQFASTFLPDGASTVAELLRAAGYDTAAFICNPGLNHTRRLDQGFDLYDEDLERSEIGGSLLLERDAETVTNAAIYWISQASRPWFLWIHYQDPHGPYHPPDAPRARDVSGHPRLPLLVDHSGHGGIPAYQALPDVFTASAYQERYLDEIRYLDVHVGRLVDLVDRADDRPGILLTSDHGEAFGEDDFWFAHGHSVGLDQIRVPLFWRPPGAPVVGEVQTPVTTLDIAPTLLAAAGIEQPAEFQGRVLPTAGDQGLPAYSDRALFSEHRLRAGVIAGRVYFARDREPLSAPVEDRITGGSLPPLPPRSARLSYGGKLPGYEPRAAGGPASDAREARPLETLLADFLEAAGDPSLSHTGELPDQRREELRALGYLE